MFYPLLSIAIGSILGGWLRWGLSCAFNAIFPPIPLGTLTANLIGGYLVGLAIAFFTQHTDIPPEARLLVITGFLGGLTTFSTFSAEVVTLLMNGQVVWGILAAMLHVCGSLLLTTLGIATAKLLA